MVKSLQKSSLFRHRYRIGGIFERIYFELLNLNWKFPWCISVDNNDTMQSALWQQLSVPKRNLTVTPMWACRTKTKQFAFRSFLSSRWTGDRNSLCLRNQKTYLYSTIPKSTCNAFLNYWYNGITKFKALIPTT